MKFQNSSGRASAGFIIVITVIACTALFLVFEIYRDRMAEYKIEMAEAIQTYGEEKVEKVLDDASPIDLLPDPNKLIQEERDSRRMQDAEQGQIWINRLTPLILNHDLLQIENSLQELDASSLPSHIKVQVKDRLFELAVLKVKNREIMDLFMKRQVNCDFGSIRGKELLERTLEEDSLAAFTLMIDAGCGDFPSRERKQLLVDISIKSLPDIEPFVQALKNKPALQADVVKKLIDAHRADDIALLQKKKLLDANLMIERKSLLGYAIKKQMFDFSHSLLDNGADPLFVLNKYEDYALIDALRFENLPLSKHIIDVRPEYLANPNNTEKIFSILNSKSENLDLVYTITRLSLENGAKLSSLEQGGARLLNQAIENGSAEQVELLLKNDVDIDSYLRRKTSLQLAMEQEHQESPKIVALLRKAGAEEDVLAIFRKQRGIDENKNCALKSEIIPSSFFESAFTTLNKRLLERKKNAKGLQDLSVEEACMLGVRHCTNLSYGADSCVLNAPICSIKTEGKAVCCASVFKQEYESARCSGLEVNEAFYFVANSLYY